MPSHWITTINVRVDAATMEKPQSGLTWMLCRPYAFLPPVKYRDWCQLAPRVQEWLQEQMAIPAMVHYEHRWGLGLGLPLDYFTNDEQRHLVAHQMRNLPTMMVLMERIEHRNMRLSMQCLLRNSSPETARHLWECPVQSHEWRLVGSTCTCG